MTYRTPIVVGDRVALAPHLDLWMAGVRYGTVLAIEPLHDGQKMYRVQWGRPDQVTPFGIEELLGAVGPTAAEREASARSSIEPPDWRIVGGMSPRFEWREESEEYGEPGEGEYTYITDGPGS